MISIRLFQALGFVLLVIITPGLYVQWRSAGWRRSAGRRQSAALLDGRRWSVLVFLVLLAGLFTRIQAISLLAGLGLIALSVCWVWHRILSTGLRYECHIERASLSPGETTRIRWTLSNRTWLSVGCVRWQEALPITPLGNRHQGGIEVQGVEIRPIFDGTALGLHEIDAIDAHATLSRSATVRGCRRGVYRFGAAELSTSDGLGLFTAMQREAMAPEVVVQPRLHALDDLEIPSLALLPDLRERHSLFDDPSWYRGARRYGPTDPIKQIDWNVTARTQQLHVKLFEPIAQPKLAVVAHLHAFERAHEGHVTDYMEGIISVAGSVAWWALDRGCEVGLMTNGARTLQAGPVLIPPAPGDQQLEVILDALGRIDAVDSWDVNSFLRSDNPVLAADGSLVLCSSVVTNEMVQALAELAQSRHVALVLIDTTLSPYIPGVIVVHGRSGGRAAA